MARGEPLKALVDSGELTGDELSPQPECLGEGDDVLLLGVGVVGGGPGKGAEDGNASIIRAALAVGGNGVKEAVAVSGDDVGINAEVPETLLRFGQREVATSAAGRGPRAAGRALEGPPGRPGGVLRAAALLGFRGSRELLPPETKQDRALRVPGGPGAAASREQVWGGPRRGAPRREPWGSNGAGPAVGTDLYAERIGWVNRTERGRGRVGVSLRLGSRIGQPRSCSGTGFAVTFLPAGWVFVSFAVCTPGRGPLQPCGLP